MHLGKTYCLEVFIVEGDIEKVLEFVGRIRAMKDIQEVKYAIAPSSEE
ncbi:MAG TPA: hypothetical protein ENF33_04145 [Nitrososphaeria archaeon]|nr:hypothetical protein [Nitrososphaeria archaeon]